MRNLKLVKVANVRKHMDAHFRDEISYTEAVNRINEDANQALNISDVSERLDKKIDERITKLQSDWNEYTKPKRFELTYTPEGHEYHKSIPIRLEELEWMLKNVY